MKATIITLPGDGIGPEVTRQAVRVLDSVAKKFGHNFEFQEHLIGGVSIESTGSPLTTEALTACQTADAVLLGAVGGPKWDDPRATVRPEQGLLAVRKGMGLYANLRPVKPHPQLAPASPLRPEKLRGVDLLVVRELTGGLYFGLPKERRWTNGSLSAVDTMEYHDFEIERILRMAFELSRRRQRRVTSVDKANILETSRLWREIATRVAAEYENVALDHMLVDTAAMRLVASPAQFDVIVTENTFGDILTDEAAVLVGSMGLLPSASLGDGKRGLYEPVHGSAPDIAGKGIANPIGSILSAAMLLRHSLGLETEAKVIEAAVDRALSDGCRTADIGQAGESKLTTAEMTDEILKRMGDGR